MKSEAQDDERRRFHRVGFHADALLKLPADTLSVEILDISLAGALIKVDPAVTLEQGSQASLIVRLSEEVQIKMTGDLLSHGHGNYALHRILREPENDNHLRPLLELNLGDPKLMERDIQTLIEEYQCSA